MNVYTLLYRGLAVKFVMVNFRTRAKYFVFINKFSAMFYGTKLVFGVQMLNIYHAYNKNAVTLKFFSIL